jgi:hypothetical protein
LEEAADLTLTDPEVIAGFYAVCLESISESLIHNRLVFYKNCFWNTCNLSCGQCSPSGGGK